MSVKDITIHQCIYCNMEYGTALELFHHKDIQHAKELSNGIICSYENCLFQVLEAHNLTNNC